MLNPIVKRVLWVVASLLLTVVVAITLAVQFYLTPTKVTQLVQEGAAPYINSTLSVDQVAVKYLRTFPYITLEVDSLQITQLADSVDDLLAVERCVVKINPLSLLNKVIEVNELRIEKPSICLYVDSLHRPIEVLHLEPDTIPVVAADTIAVSSDSTQSDWLKSYGVKVDKLVIDSAVLVIDDRSKDFYAKVDSFSTQMRFTLDKQVSFMEVKMGLSELYITHKGKTLARDINLKFASYMEHHREAMQLTFDHADFTLNGIEMNTSGSLTTEPTHKKLFVDIASHLKTPSLAEFIHLIPSTIIDKEEGVEAAGEVQFDMQVVGEYSDHSIPEVKVNFEIKEGGAKYGSKQLSVEDLNCLADMKLNFNHPDSSYLNFDNLTMSSQGIVEVKANGLVKHLLTDPLVDINLLSNINFGRFAELFPLQNGVDFEGKSDSDLHIKFLLSDMQKSNYGKLYMDGAINFDAMKVVMDAGKFMADSTMNYSLNLDIEKAALLFGDRVRSDNNSRTLLSTIQLTDLGFNDKSGQYIRINNMNLTAGANFDNRTTKVNGVGIKSTIDNIHAGVYDMMELLSERTEMVLTITPETEQKKANIKGNIKSQKLAAEEYANHSKVALTHAIIEVDLLRRKPKVWGIKSDVEFANLSIFSQIFPLPIAVPSSKITVNNRKIELLNTPIQIGSSELFATGSINNLLRPYLNSGLKAEGREISGNLVIDSKMLDLGELIEATNQSVMMTDTTTTTTAVAPTQPDSAAVATSSIMLVPKQIDFTFDLNVDRAIFDTIPINRLKGRAAIKEGVLTFSDLGLNVIGADATGNMTYSNIGQDSALVNLDFNLQRVEIDRIGELVPSIDSMMPMIQSFEGVVDFGFKAKSRLDSNLNFDIKTLKGAASFNGKDMVLMDSKTFKQLSKMLLFKNKKRNLVDSIGAYATIQQSIVTILPFEMSIDRYRAIIGGFQVVNPQTFDLFYSYNVSIIKSPLPFKSGVDLTGNIEDFKFNITKAKLKDTNFDEVAQKYQTFLNSF